MASSRLTVSFACPPNLPPVVALKIARTRDGSKDEAGQEKIVLPAQRGLSTVGVHHLVGAPLLLL